MQKNKNKKSIWASGQRCQEAQITGSSLTASSGNETGARTPTAIGEDSVGQPMLNATITNDQE